MNKRLLAAIIVAFSCASASAQVRGPDTEWRKSINGFGVSLDMTKDAEEFVREWTTTPSTHRLAIREVREVHVGEYVTPLAFFWGCRPAGDGCRIYADYELIAPNGSVRYSVPDRTGTVQPGPKADLVYLSQHIVRFRIEATDPLGQYKINATVREPLTGNVVRVTQRFRAVK